MRKQRIVAIFILVIFIPSVVLIPLWQAGIIGGNNNNNPSPQPPARQRPFINEAPLDVFLDYFSTSDDFSVTIVNDDGETFMIILENNVETVAVPASQTYLIIYSLNTASIWDDFPSGYRHFEMGEYFPHPFLGHIYLDVFVPNVLGGIILDFFNIDNETQSYKFGTPNDLTIREIYGFYEIIISLVPQALELE